MLFRSAHRCGNAVPWRETRSWRFFCSALASTTTPTIRGSRPGTLNRRATQGKGNPCTPSTTLPSAPSLFNYFVRTPHRLDHSRLRLHTAASEHRHRSSSTAQRHLSAQPELRPSNTFAPPPLSSTMDSDLISVVNKLQNSTSPCTRRDRAGMRSAGPALEQRELSPDR